jgi:hypothetical protein
MGVYFDQGTRLFRLTSRLLASTQGKTLFPLDLNKVQVHSPFAVFKLLLNCDGETFVRGLIQQS